MAAGKKIHLLYRIWCCLFQVCCWIYCRSPPTYNKAVSLIKHPFSQATFDNPGRSTWPFCSYTDYPLVSCPFSIYSMYCTFLPVTSSSLSSISLFGLSSLFFRLCLCISFLGLSSSDCIVLSLFSPESSSSEGMQLTSSFLSSFESGKASSACCTAFLTVGSTTWLLNLFTNGFTCLKICEYKIQNYKSLFHKILANMFFSHHLTNIIYLGVHPLLSQFP